jgi:cephalosporin hydroxylase
LTIVPPRGEITLDQMAERVQKTRRDHGQLLLDYHKVWYESGHTWPYTHFLGVGLMKNPNDLWIYQDLIAALKPKTIIETGTYAGGSALWFAFLMDAMCTEGRIITIDLDDHRQCSHPRITFVGGDSTDPDLAQAVLAEVEHPLLVTLDADHSAEHVRKELELYAPHVRVGEWLIVEDTNIGWSGPGGDRGARGGLEEYLLAHEGEFRQDVLSERYLLTMNPGGWLERVAECTHG